MRLPEGILDFEVYKGNIDHQDRTKFYGGSDMPAIVGEDPYKTPLMLWYEKKGLYVPEQTEQMLIGKEMEKPIINVFKNKTGYVVYDEVPSATKKPPFELSLPVIGHADGIVFVDGEPAILEIKNLNAFNKNWDHYKWQVLLYMWLYNVKRGMLVILRGGSQLIFEIFDMNEEDLDYMFEMLQKFDYYLKHDIRPDAMGTDREIDLLMQLQNYDLEVKLDIDSIVEEYVTLGEEISRLKKEQNKLKALILEELEQKKAGIGVTDNYVVKLVKGVRKIKPVLEEKEVEYKQLRIKKRGKDEEVSDNE
jgi:predicted phage-related endonuclease